MFTWAAAAAALTPAELKARNAHWLDTGAAAFSAEDLLAVGRSLTGKTVGELEHGERGRRR